MFKEYAFCPMKALLVVCIALLGAVLVLSFSPVRAYAINETIEMKVGQELVMDDEFDSEGNTNAGLHTVVSYYYLTNHDSADPNGSNVVKVYGKNTDGPDTDCSYVTFKALKAGSTYIEVQYVSDDDPTDVQDTLSYGIIVASESSKTVAIGSTVDLGYEWYIGGGEDWLDLKSSNTAVAKVDTSDSLEGSDYEGICVKGLKSGTATITVRGGWTWECGEEDCDEIHYETTMYDIIKVTVLPAAPLKTTSKAVLYKSFKSAKTGAYKGKVGSTKWISKSYAYAKKYFHLSGNKTGIVFSKYAAKVKTSGGKWVKAERTAHIKVTESGKIYVTKGLQRGTYKVTVKCTAKPSTKYSSSSPIYKTLVIVVK